MTCDRDSRTVGQLSVRHWTGTAGLQVQLPVTGTAGLQDCRTAMSLTAVEPHKGAGGYVYLCTDACIVVYMCIFVYMCVRACAYSCVYVRIRAYGSVYVRICAYASVYVRTRRAHERFELAFLSTSWPSGAETLIITTQLGRLALPYRIL